MNWRETNPDFEILVPIVFQIFVNFLGAGGGDNLLINCISPVEVVIILNNLNNIQLIRGARILVESPFFFN